MQDKQSDRQKINAELAVRALNIKNSKILKNHIPEEEQAELKILFNCECADPNCSERLSLTLDEYDRLHTLESRFVIAKDHLEPDIEKVRASDDDIAVVEKYALS